MDRVWDAVGSLVCSVAKMLYSTLVVTKISLWVRQSLSIACLQDPLNIYNFSILLWCLQVDRRVHVVLDSVLGILLKCLHSTVSSSAPCWYVRARDDSRARTVLHMKTSTATRLMRSMWRHFWQCICMFESQCICPCSSDSLHLVEGNYLGQLSSNSVLMLRHAVIMQCLSASVLSALGRKRSLGMRGG